VRNFKLIWSHAQQNNFKMKISIIDIADIILLILELRLKLKKVELKKYSWVNTILKSLQVILTATHWDDWFEKSKSYFIHNDWNRLSIHMNETQVWQIKKTVVHWHLLEKHTWKIFNLCWNHIEKMKMMKKLNEHIKQHIKFNNIWLSDCEIVAEQDFVSILMMRYDTIQFTNNSIFLYCTWTFLQCMSFNLMQNRWLHIDIKFVDIQFQWFLNCQFLIRY
jgi:hypothetical protein